MRLIQPNIYSFADYRTYLKEFYEVNKAAHSAFSYRYFGQAAGMKSYNYLKLVIDGERALTPTFIPGFKKALRLSEAESNYFEKMVEFQHESDTSKKVVLFNSLLALRPALSKTLVVGDKITALEEWYYFPIVELTDVEGFKSDPAWIAKRLSLKESVVKKAIRKLIVSGFLEEKDGRLVKKNAHNDTPDEVSQYLLKKYHHDNLHEAAKKIFQQDIHEREYGNVVFATNPEQFARIKARIKEIRKEIFEISNEPVIPGKEVYQFSVQFFRVTEKETK